MNLPLSVCNFSGICSKLGFDKPLLFPQSLIQEMMFLDQCAHQFPARVCCEIASSQVRPLQQELAVLKQDVRGCGFIATDDS